MKTYYVRFGSGDPRPYVGLSPTFLIYNNYGVGVTPPGITGVIGATGFYAFQWGTTTAISFLIDGATTGLLPGERYVTGSIDPVDRMDEVGTTLVAIGTSNIALGTTAVQLGVLNLAQGSSIYAVSSTLAIISSSLSIIGLLIGSTASSFGGTNLPNDLFGYAMRTIENLEGNMIFTKPSGQLQILSRGSSVLLTTKSIANSVSMVVKT